MIKIIFVFPELSCRIAYYLMHACRSSARNLILELNSLEGVSVDTLIKTNENITAFIET